MARRYYLPRGCGPWPHRGQRRRQPWSPARGTMWRVWGKVATKPPGEGVSTQRVDVCEVISEKGKRPRGRIRAGARLDEVVAVDGGGNRGLGEAGGDELRGRRTVAACVRSGGRGASAAAGGPGFLLRTNCLLIRQPSAPGGQPSARWRPAWRRGLRENCRRAGESSASAPQEGPLEGTEQPLLGLTGPELEVGDTTLEAGSLRVIEVTVDDLMEGRERVSGGGEDRPLVPRRSAYAPSPRA